MKTSGVIKAVLAVMMAMGITVGMYIAFKGMNMAHEQLMVLVASSMFQKNAFFPNTPVDYMFWVAVLAPFIPVVFFLDRATSEAE